MALSVAGVPYRAGGAQAAMAALEAATTERNDLAAPGNRGMRMSSAMATNAGSNWQVRVPRLRSGDEEQEAGPLAWRPMPIRSAKMATQQGETDDAIKDQGRILSSAPRVIDVPSSLMSIGSILAQPRRRSRVSSVCNTELGRFSAFAYPYLIFQIAGGWVGDRFRSRKTLFWCGAIWAVATILTGPVSGLFSLFISTFLLDAGFGEGATFPGLRGVQGMDAG